MSNPSCLRLLRVKVQPSAVRRATPVLSSRQKPSTPGTCIPSFGEDKEAACTSFHKAFGDSLPEATRIPGLQAFAGAIWERQRRIPSTTYNDPLGKIFNEFDADGDGHLTAQEIADALLSNNVKITPAQVQVFIDSVDVNQNKTIERAEFPDLIFHMATADLNVQHKAPQMRPV